MGRDASFHSLLVQFPVNEPPSPGSPNRATYGEREAPFQSLLYISLYPEKRRASLYTH
jgi:hypothetical protein